MPILAEFYKRKLSLFMAWRYLFSRKKRNVINLITRISMGGVAVGTMAMVCVLSIMNGFDSLIRDTFSHFDPELRICAKNHQPFSLDTDIFRQIRKDTAIVCFAEIVEDNALVSYQGSQVPVILRGVDEHFERLVDMKNRMYSGKFQLHHLQFNVAVTGIGIAQTLDLTTDYVNPIRLYVPKRTGKINLARPEAAFKQGTLFVSGIFTVMRPEYDDRLVIVPIEFAREMYGYTASEVTSVELKLSTNQPLASFQKTLQQALGSDFKVLNRMEQQADLYHIILIEKWITFLILALILLIAISNIIGSLSMLLIDKGEDIILLTNLGADGEQVRQIFLYTGWLISVIGAVTGLIIGVGLSLIQQHAGIITMGEGLITESYPVVVKYSDLILVLLTVLTMGFLSAILPVRLLNRKKISQ
ncbi:MAG: ABC transporter permease [Prevotellaceae bacterium]|jgi:ABC-type lipoprotein release transport system permease subunit|nr:ABC transporter permease [Prevotellaceae bacterium]